MRIVAGTARSRTILAPEGRDTRPTLDRVRENLFNILQWHCRDAQVLKCVRIYETPNCWAEVTADSLA